MKKSSKKDENITTFKIGVFGYKNTGKTTFIAQYLHPPKSKNSSKHPSKDKKEKDNLEEDDNNEGFVNNYETFCLGDKKHSMKILIWDTLGYDKDKKISKQFIDNLDGYLVLFSLNDEATFKGVFEEIIPDIKEFGKENGCNIIVVGNKKDQIKEEPSFDSSKLDKDIKVFLSSAINRENVEEPFDELIKMLCTKKLNKTFNHLSHNVKDKKCIIF